MSWAEVVVAVTAFASAVIGGALFGFSTFVMKALGRLAPAEGIRAMQRINEDTPQGVDAAPPAVTTRFAGGRGPCRDGQGTG